MKDYYSYLKKFFKEVNCFLFLLLISTQGGNCQVRNPHSIAYPNKALFNQQCVSTNLLPLPPALPMGFTSDDIIRQTNDNARKTMGLPSIQTPPNNSMQAHQFILSQATNGNQNVSTVSREEIRKILFEQAQENNKTLTSKNMEVSKNYETAFYQLLDLIKNPKEAKLKDAIFIIENSFLDNTLDPKFFNASIQQYVNAIQQILSAEKLNSSSSLAKNYAIQKLFFEKTSLYNNGKLVKTLMPFKYDFVDFNGEIDWTKMFVSKLLKSGTGQCHSLPLLYLILAEEVEADAWLSLAPEHSFIIFSENAKRNYYNFETTNGNIVTNDWIMESGYINSLSIKNRLYLDTLSRKQLYSTLLADLIMGYTTKIGYNEFTFSMIDSLTTISPDNLQGQMLKADMLIVKTKALIEKYGSPPIEQLKNYPDAYRAYATLLEQYQFIERMGYTPVPKEAYENWLSSCQSEKNKQNSQVLKNQIITNVKSTH